MMTISSSSRLAAAAAVLGLLLLAPVPQAEARSEGKTAVTAADGYRPRPVIRDHRKNPQPWSLPPHYHRH